MATSSFHKNILTHNRSINNNYYNLVIILDIDNHYHSI